MEAFIWHIIEFIFIGGIPGLALCFLLESFEKDAKERNQKIIEAINSTKQL